MMGHFIRVCTFCYYKIDLQRKKHYIIFFNCKLCPPQYIQWTILTLLYVALWKIPLVLKGLKSLYFLFSANGWYIFIETSSPRRPNDTAVLVSPTINDGQSRCLSFWYHMYGTHINSLNVYLLNAGTTGLGNNIFRRRGNQGNKWIQGEVTIQTQPGYKVSLSSDKSY